MYVLSREREKGCASGVGYCVAGCVLQAGAGGSRTSAGFRVFSLMQNIATLKKWSDGLDHGG